MKKYRKKIILPLIIITVIVSIGITQSSYYRKISQSQRLINQVYNRIVSTYLHQLDPEEFSKATINSLTENLDPFTSFIVEDDQYNINILTRGKYGGVGIQLGYRNNTMSVIAPMDGGPAKKAGIISGDIIIKIDDEDVKKYSFNDAAAKIRGQKGTTVKLTVKRFGDDEPIDFSLIRSEITVKDVTYSGMISNTTGYIRLNRFSTLTPSEMRSSIKSLLNSKASEIVLDLRDNSGGLLSAAIDVLDLIIPKDVSLVSTKGRSKESNRTFYSRNNPLIPEDIKIAILINQGSASSSEIVAGAIQDLDRGIIIGNKSYGKGLVQTVFSIDSKRSVKVTTARYYIPSGRFIQNPDYIDNKYILNKTKEDSTFTTLNGRTVYANGGITPDSTITLDPMKSLTSQFWRNGYFYSFAQENKYRYNSFQDVLKDKNLLMEFEKYLDKKDNILLPGQKELITVSEKINELDSTDINANKALKDLNAFYMDQQSKQMITENNELKEILLLEFAGLFNGPEGRLKQALKDDKVIKTALDMLSDKKIYQASLSPKEIIEN